jgi:hypothetical protein
VDAATCVEWLVARVKVLPKKGDLSRCKNLRAICLLDVASKIVSTVMVGRFQAVLKEERLEEQCGFMGGRLVFLAIWKIRVLASGRTTDGRNRDPPLKPLVLRTENRQNFYRHFFGDFKSGLRI